MAKQVGNYVLLTHPECYPCPEGGVCEEGAFDPYSDVGYYESNIITNTFVQCVPLEVSF